MRLGHKRSDKTLRRTMADKTRFRIIRLLSRYPIKPDAASFGMCKGMGPKSMPNTFSPPIGMANIKSEKGMIRVMIDN